MLAPVNGKYLIYVEDDPDDVDLFRDSFSGVNDLGIMVFKDGESLLGYLEEISQEHFPSLIVLDINTPVLGGWGTAKALFHNPTYRNIPVVMFSSSAMENGSKNSKLYGVEVLSKPCDMGEAKCVAKKMLAYCNAAPTK